MTVKTTMRNIIVVLFLFFLIGFLLGTTLKLALAWRNPSVSPPGGTEQAIQADESGNVTISTGNLTISVGGFFVATSSNAKVGIRNTSPASVLHVSGHLRVGDTGAGGRKGITLFDTVDGQAYCFRITSTTATTSAGTCETVLGGQ